MLGRECLHEQPPVTTLGVESLMSSQVGTILHVLSKLMAGGIVFYTTPLGFTWKLVPDFLLTSVHLHFSFAGTLCAESCESL